MSFGTLTSRHLTDPNRGKITDVPTEAELGPDPKDGSLEDAIVAEAVEKEEEQEKSVPSTSNGQP